MAKSGLKTKELQRRLVRLTRLDGRQVSLADGVWLFWPEYVRDARPLVQALRAGSGLTSAVLRQSLQLQHAPLPLTGRWLAAAQHDLRALQKDPDALLHTQAAARRFRGLPPPTPAWLAERQQRLRELAAELQKPAIAPALAQGPAVPPTGQVAASVGPPFFLAVVALLRTLRSPADATALQLLWERSVAASQLPTARRRLAGLLERLAGQPEPRHDETRLGTFLAEVARDIRSLLGPDLPPGQKRLLGRARLRRLWRLVHRVIHWPAEPSDAHAPELDSAALSALGDRRTLLTTLAAPLLAALPRPRDPQHRARLALALAHYSLLFRVDRDCQVVTAPELDWLEQQLERATAQLAPHGLTLPQALGLLRLPATDGDLGPLARHLSTGLPAELLLRTCELGYAAELRGFTGEPAALRAYCEWVVRLAPLYQQSGRKLELSPAITTRFPALREPNLALLVHCLVSAAGEAEPRSLDVDRQLTVLDAAVGLCGRVPQRAAALVSLLTTWPAGAGGARFPEFAAWLGDDAGLDRYVHLAGLAGEPAELSRTLLRDFARAERLLRERSYLTALPTPTADQAQRLHTVHATLAANPLPSPSWTRRRLSERLTELLGRALRRQLDLALREVLRQGLGVAPEVLTPAWRDAVRFYLLTERNDELLGTLLRFAAAHPGRSPARVFLTNQRWLRHASEHLQVDGWLAARRSELELDGQRYVLSVEEDPIEVLRMGIPFGTCLSLAQGCNAAAAVSNAVDANKRVLYLRDRRGVIVGRKLIAISARWGLLGYELYLSLEARLRPQVTAAVLALCEAVAHAAGVPLVASGAPEPLHDGFWYDDGPQPFISPPGADPDVSAYCRRLGQPVPRPSTPELHVEAAQWQAQKSGSVAQALQSLRAGRQSLSDEELGAWLIDQMGPLPAEQAAREQPCLQPFVLRRLADQGAQRILQVAASFARCDAYEVRQHVAAAPPSALLAVALLEAAERVRRRGERPDDHGLCHLSFSELEPSLALTTIGPLLALCDRLQTLWDWFVETQTGCQGCRESAEEAVLRATRVAFARRPDPASVITCLRSRRTSRLAQRAALHLAAAFRLSTDAEPPRALAPQVSPPSPGAPKALRAVHELVTWRAELVGEPDFLAALLRQAPRPLRLDLPTPARPPFEALADLLLEPATRQLVAGRVAHLVSGPEALAAYRPGPWELYYHRRHETPLRKRAARAAQAHDGATPFPQPLLGLLVDLGDFSTLSTLSLRFPSGHRGRQVREALAGATAVAAQVELDSVVGDGVPLLPARGRGDKSAVPPALILDRELLRRVWHAVEQALRMEPPIDPEGSWALRLLTTAPLSRSETIALAERLVGLRGGCLAPGELEFLSWFLQHKTTWELPEVTAEFAVELWQLPPLRSHLAAALANGSRWPLRYRQMQQVAQRTGRVLDGLLAQWLPLQLDRDVETAVAAITTRAELELLLEVALSHRQPLQWLAIYRALGGYAEAACFLHRLRAAGPDPETVAQLQGLVDGTSWHYPDETARAGWLRTLLGELSGSS